MSKFFYFQLAWSNIKKNKKMYFPYILTCTVTVAMYYLIHSLAGNEGFGSGTVRAVLGLAVNITAIFAVIFLFYTNSFLMKRRKREFGLYNILGMEKKHLGRVVFWETADVAAISLAAGFVLGILLDRLMFLAILRLIGEEIPVAFRISVDPVLSVLCLFGIIFLLIFLNSIRQIHLSKPIELLRGGNVGEKEPKAKWLVAVLGLGCLALGYYISVTTTNPVAALSLFFVAVVLVILGTYLTFMAGSIAFLKILRKNKGYYYQARHFTSISGMIYRMKQNACGLANVCILSTMTLVMVAATLSMWMGMNGIIRERFPREICASSNRPEDGQTAELRAWMDGLLQQEQVVPENLVSYSSLSFSVLEQGEEFLSGGGSGENLLSQVNQLRNLFFVSLEDYNRINGTDETLEDGEVLFYSNGEEYTNAQFQVFGGTFRIKKQLKEFEGNNLAASDIASSYFVVVKDLQAVSGLFRASKDGQETQVYYNDYYAFDMGGEEQQASALYGKLQKAWTEAGLSGNVGCRYDSRQNFIEMYGSLFFIGVFLGALFIMATILIIYYKQISEGYEDKERFEIMQKVGMDQAETKRSIRSQILTVFFLPLIMAGIHMAFAFPSVSRVLALLNMVNVPLFLGCNVVCYLVFAVFYVAVYGVTAKMYYRIIKDK